MTKLLAQSPESNDLWDYRRVASHLGISESKAKRLPIPRVKIGRLVRFVPERVREWIEGQSVPRSGRRGNG